MCGSSSSLVLVPNVMRGYFSASAIGGIRRRFDRHLFNGITEWLTLTPTLFRRERGPRLGPSSPVRSDSVREISQPELPRERTIEKAVRVQHAIRRDERG